MPKEFDDKLEDINEINGAHSLVKLRLAHCKFSIVSNLFLPNLHKLYITDNPNLHEIGSNVLFRLPLLEKLIIARNRNLSRLDIDFIPLEKLILLDCSGNTLSEVPENLLNFLSALQRKFVLLIGLSDPFDFQQEARTLFKKIPENYQPNPFDDKEMVKSLLPKSELIKIL